MPSGLAGKKKKKKKMAIYGDRDGEEMAIYFAPKGTKFNAKCHPNASSQSSHVAEDATDPDVSSVYIRVSSSSSAASRSLDAGRHNTQTWHGRRRNMPRINCSVREILCGVCVAFVTFSTVFAGALFCMGWVPPTTPGRRVTTNGRREPQTLAPPTDNETKSKLAIVPLQQTRYARPGAGNGSVPTRAPLLLRLLNSALLKRRLRELQARGDGFITEYGLLL